MLNKSNQKGFTLIEVMVGITLLVIAIVGSSSLLSGLVKSNQANQSTMEAYYLAAEGLEAVRNIRDTNWLNNGEWLGDDLGVWGSELEVGKEYGITLSSDGFSIPPSRTNDITSVRAVSPWVVIEGGGDLMANSTGLFVDGGSIDSGFRRVISLEEYGEHVRVTSTVTWSLGADAREFKLSTILSNWKDGVL